MARYLFRLSILGPRALDAAQVGAAVDEAFRRLGFATEPATITNIKGIAPPTLRMVDRETGASAYIATVPPWGEVELDFSTAAQNVRVLTQASIVFHGTLPPTNASGRSGSAQVSNAIFAAVNAAFGSSGFFNLTGAGREAGLVAAGGGNGWLALLGLAAIGAVASKRRRR